MLNTRRVAILSNCCIQDAHLQLLANHRINISALFDLLDHASTVLGISKLAEQDLLFVNCLNIDELQQSVGVVLW
jgi:hypothetical protein